MQAAQSATPVWALIRGFSCRPAPRPRTTCGAGAKRPCLTSKTHRTISLAARKTGLLAMTAAAEKTNETLTFKADVAKLLHMMVHSVYSDRDVFLRELISNAADACERLRYEAIDSPACLATTRRSGSPW